MSKNYKKFLFASVIIVFAFYVSPILLNLRISTAFIVVLSLFLISGKKESDIDMFLTVFMVGVADLFRPNAFGLITILFLLVLMFMNLFKRWLSFGDRLAGRLVFAAVGTVIFYAGIIFYSVLSESGNFV